MNFSNFAKMLYPFIGEGKKISDFIIHLTDQIMEKPFRESDKQKDINDKYNPLSQKSLSTLEKIYSGSREMSKKDAGMILAHIDKEKFNEYLSGFSVDVTDGIGRAMRDNGIEIANHSVPSACADLFASILVNCAQKNRAPHVKSSATKASSPCHNIKAENSAPSETVSNQASKVFVQVSRDYGIPDFLNQDLQSGIDTDSLPLIDRFIETIEFMANQMEPSGNREQIVSFVKTLFEYKKYMEKGLLRSQNAFLKKAALGMIPEVLGGGVIRGAAKLTFALMEKNERDEYARYRRKLKKLYGKICGDDPK